MRQGYNQEHKMFVATNSENPLFELYENPSLEEVKQLETNSKIDFHSLRAALMTESMPRVELEFSHIAVILKTPKPSLNQTSIARTTSLGFFLFENKLIIVTPEKIPILGERFITRKCSPTTVFLHSLEVIAEHFSTALSNINKRYDELESLVNSSTDNRYLLDLFAMEKSLLYFLSALNTNSFVIEKIRSIIQNFGCGEEDLAHLETVILEYKQCYQEAQIYANILSSLSSARASIVGNNLSALMKTLNIVTIGIMVPTFVVSIFSMNVEIPLQREHHAFVFILTLAIISVLLFILFFWKYASSAIRR